MRPARFALAMVSLGLTSSLAVAAPTTYEFDTVTSISMHSSNPSITGVLRNAATPTTVSFIDITNVEYRYIVNRCVPVFLTMMEKPGRYFLNVTIEPTNSNIQLIACELKLRS
jgi:hypothetical protein